MVETDLSEPTVFRAINELFVAGLIEKSTKRKHVKMGDAAQPDMEGEIGEMMYLTCRQHWQRRLRDASTGLWERGLRSAGLRNTRRTGIALIITAIRRQTMRWMLYEDS